MACEQTSSAASNDERQKDPERINVMFLCDEWKSSKGGLSTFNREFAVNLVKTTSDSIKVHCYVAQSDEQSREDARQHGVNLISAQSIPGSSDPLDWLKIPPPELPNPDIVVGHGRKFGTPAYFIVRAAKCKWMHFVHVFCEDLGKFKATESAAVDTIEENEKKHKSEIELCKAADVVVAVGSRLQQKYSRSLPNVKVEIITPGILEKFSNESPQLVKDRSVVKNFNVFMFGRASFEDLTFKGYDIVANAIGSRDKMFELTFVGSSPGEHRKIEQWFLDNTCISRNQLTIRSYCNEQDELKMMFHESDMIALPSRTEGFGLVALEAISAGTPVLVAGESGIAEALHEVEGGQSVIVESDDAKEWAQRIQQLSSQSPEERENNAKLLRNNYNKTYPWSNECERFKRMFQDLAESLNALKLKIDVETMTPREHNTQDRTPASTEEPGGSQNGQHQEACAVPVPSGHTQPSCAGAEAPQEPNSIPTEGEVLRLIAVNYLQAAPLRCKDDCDDFLTYMEKMRVVITGVDTGSLLITVKCDSLQILESLWEDYSSGHLSEVVQRCFVTEEILTKLNLAELKLETTVAEEEYKAYKAYFEKDPTRERVEEGDLLTQTDDKELKMDTDEDYSVLDDEGQHESVAAVLEEKTAHFTDEKMLTERVDEDDLLTQTDDKELKMETDEDNSVLDKGISSSMFLDPVSWYMYLLQERLPQIVREGLETFDVSSPEGLQDYVTYLSHKMYNAGLLRTRGSASDKPLSTWEHPLKKGSHRSTSHEKQPCTEEEKTSQEGGTTGDQCTASCLGSELQGEVKWARSIVMQKTSKPVQESPSVKHLTEAMYEEELKEIVSIHVQEDKWQVVMLFLDELPRRRGLNSLDLGEIYITDEGVKHIAEALSNSTCKLNKLNSLIFSSSNKITDEGVKHIADALSNSNCQLNRLVLIRNKITDEGVKHIAEALSNTNCKLNRLTLICNKKITDEGVKHIAEALSNTNCQLTFLELRGINITDEGVKYIAEALSNSNCQLNSLELIVISITDKGVKYLAEALSSGDCKLNRLNLSGNNKILDEGVKYIAEALSNSECKLNSLIFSWNNKITDKGVKHIAEALSNSDCKLNRLNLSRNNNITDKGVKHLAEALKYSNYNLESLNRLHIEVTAEVKGQVSEEGLS